MLRLRFLCFSLALCCCFLYGEDYPQRFEGSFEAWESQPLKLIAHFLPLNPIIFQAGGYEGTEAAGLALQWPLSKIFSFEPNPPAFNALLLKTRNFKNIKAYNLALSGHSGPATFYVCHGSTGENQAFAHASSLLPPSECMEIHYRGPRFPIECVALDEWCLQNKIGSIDFLRLDVQGSELQVLKSASRILSTIKVIYVATYFFPFRIGTTQYPELRDFLQQAGFKPLSHWYREGLQGSAIFVRDDIFHAVPSDFIDLDE